VTPFAAGQTPYLADAASNSDHYFVELLRPDPTLLIVGAGHVGEQLAKIAHLAGFQIAVQDERPEWANAQRYPEALIFTIPIAATLQSFTQCTQLYVALVTRSYQQDLEALTVLLQRPTPCTYVGMIGSQKRVQQVYQALAQLLGKSAQLPQIHAPIGLDIGALTPAEIAVSICAELIQVRRCGHIVLQL
jgi:xanthine dehydrogenase accessory factor